MDAILSFYSFPKFYEGSFSQNGSTSSPAPTITTLGAQPHRTGSSLSAQRQQLHHSGLKQGFELGAAFQSQLSHLLVI